MAVYQITIEKYMQSASEYWTNVYHVNAEGGAPLAPIFDPIVAAERALTFSLALFTKATVRAVAAGGNLGVSYAINLLGSRVATVDLLPLFVVARIDFTVPGSRPSRKYLRACIDEANGSFHSLDPQFVALLNNYASAIVAVPGICDVDGQTITAGSGRPFIAMRQLRRGAKKKLIP